MKQPVPKATPQAIAADKAQIASRGSLGTVGKVMENFHKGPDVSEATKVGEPTLVDPKQASAPEMVRSANDSVKTYLEGAGVGNHVTVRNGEGRGTASGERAGTALRRRCGRHRCRRNHAAPAPDATTRAVLPMRPLPADRRRAAR